MNTLLQTASFLHAGSHVRHGGWRMGRHSHQFHELVVVQRGGQETVIQCDRLVAGEGDLLLYPAGEVHEEQQTRQDVLETDFIGFVCDAIPTGWPLKVNDVHGRIRVMAQWLRFERQSGGISSELQYPALLRAILAEYARLAESPGSSRLPERLRNYVESHIAETLTLERLAGHLQLSRYHLVRKYRAMTGCTPMSEVARLRIERARDMVLTTSLPLKDIPAMTGLNDIYHMTRLFRRHLGVTPGSLRRRH